MDGWWMADGWTMYIFGGSCTYLRQRGTYEGGTYEYNEDDEKRGVED